MTASPRIGLLTPGWPGHNTPNGIATSVLFLARGLRDIGQTPVILAQKIDGDAPPDIPVVPLPELAWVWQDRLRARFGDPVVIGQRHMARRIAAAARQAIAQHRIDVLIMEETNGWAEMVSRLVPVPVILTLHGPWALLKQHASLGSAKADRQREARELRGFQAAAGLIGPSQTVMALAEQIPSLKETPKVLIRNSFHTPLPAQLAAGLPPRNILFVGRVERLKGADTVLDAFERLCRTDADAGLTFIGPDRGMKQPDGSKRHMQDLLADLPDAVRARIDFRGVVGKVEIDWLRTTHAIALIASRYENLNYSLLEAMAAGQAIVSTAIGGPLEVLEDGHTALMVPPGNAAAMAEALARLVADAPLRASLGHNARTVLDVDFKPAASAGQAVSFVRSVLAGRT
jgi:glycosyltransferase involved in cell wall biosynthesis